MTSMPIAVEPGRRFYDNTPTTVFVLASNAAKELLLLRRAKQPGYGLLGLPGGYQMRGESWQEAAARELLEETGCFLQPSFLEFVSIRTDEYQNNLIIARSQRAVSAEYKRDDEALAIFFFKRYKKPKRLGSWRPLRSSRRLYLANKRMPLTLDSCGSSCAMTSCRVGNTNILSRR